METRTVRRIGLGPFFFDTVFAGYDQGLVEEGPDGQLSLSLECPGKGKEDLTVEVEDSVLRVGMTNGDSFTSLDLSGLPYRVDLGSFSAKVDKGILTVTFKKDTTRSRKIQVE